MWDREIRMTQTFDCSKVNLWEKWSTPRGIASFFGAKQDVEFEIGGKFEILFLLENPPGSQGSEGCKILRIEAPDRIAFTWNAPPHLPNCRNQHSVVEVRLSEIEEGKTEMTLLHQGFGCSEEWDRCLEYFEKAWPMVFERLRSSI